MVELPRGVQGHAYTTMITFFFFRGGGGSFYPSNTLDRTLSVKVVDN